MGVEFNEGNNFSRKDFGNSDDPKIAAWLIKKGVAKDIAQANKIQVAAAVVFFLLAIYFGFF